MKDTSHQRKSSAKKRRLRSASVKRRSAPTTRGSTSPDTSLGEVYLDTFSPPALASTSEVYMKVYANVRAILERYSWRHAIVAPKAAWDAAASHVTQKIAACGGGLDE